MAKKTGIKTSSAKAKGRKLQQHIRDRLLHCFQLGEDDVSSRSMGAAGTDIIMSPLAREWFPISIEAKKTKKTPSRAELEQSRANVYKDTIPSVVWCPHGCGNDKSMIMFDLDEFLNWYMSLIDPNSGSPQDYERARRGERHAEGAR